MHTEEEAKSKWCPFVRAVGGEITFEGESKHAAQQGSFNRITDGAAGRVAWPTGGATCIGSQCMAWRWDAEEFREPPKRGYCGLAR